MNLTQLTINRDRLAIALFLLILLGGLLQYQSLSQDSMPPFTVRVATVVANFPGASPDRVELLVAKQIEEKIQEVPEVKEIGSQSRSGLAVVSVTLKNDVPPENIQSVWDLIRRKLETATLPDGVTYTVNDDSIGEVFGIILGMTSDDFSSHEMEVVAKDLRDRLIALDAAAKVEIQGVQEEQIYIDYDQADILRYGLTSANIQNLISGTNILYDGGELNVGDERIILEPTGNFDDLEDLRRVVVPLPNNKSVKLGDITRIYKSYVKPPVNKIRVDGKQALSIAVSLKDNANIVDLGKQVDALITNYQSRLPVGIKLTRITSLDEFVGSEVDNFVNNLMQSVAVVLGVMLFFLGLRVGLIIASLIPMVVLATLMYMGVISMGLNQVTLAGLIMALGMMVDNAVVVSESILVKLEQGASKVQAAVDTCGELIFPLLISTLTTSVAFLSFYLAETQMGDIVGPLFVVISIALVASWLLSFSMVALLCVWFIKNKGTSEKGNVFDRVIGFLRSRYRGLIRFCLRFRGLSIALIVVVFFGSLTLFSKVPFMFFPDSSRNMITVDINLPLGSRIEATEKIVQGLEQYIEQKLLIKDGENSDRPGILSWASYIGQGPEAYDLGYMADEPNAGYAHILINTTSGDDNAAVISDLDRFAFAQYPEADIKVKRLGAGGAATPIEIEVYGEDPDMLKSIADKIRLQLKQTPGSKNVSDNWGPRGKKLQVLIDQDKAQTLGLSNQDIAYALQSNLSGIQTGVFREGDDSLSIMMRNANAEHMNVDNLRELNVYSQSTGTSVPLAEIAKIEPAWQFARIRRQDMQRIITVSSELKEGYNASDVLAPVSEWLTTYAETWPPGYTYEQGGEDAEAQESFAAVLKYLPFCGFLIVMLLILQFNSMRKTFIVLCTIPLGIIGVVLGLLLLRSYFGFMAFLGMISLAGIVINNAIVLIDRIQIELAKGADGVTAVVDACVQRFRPIMLTTFTTVLGLIPLYVSGGLMWEPMAAVLMVGLLVGTMITLLFVPVAYTLLFRLKATY